MNDNNIVAQTFADCNPEFEFDSDGFPLNPATGQRFTRTEIVADPTIPYPRHVDPQNPSPYWQRRTPAELAAERHRVAEKSRQRKSRRTCASRKTWRADKVISSNTGFFAQRERTGRATADLVQRNNNESTPGASAVFVTSGDNFLIMEV